MRSFQFDETYNLIEPTFLIASRNGAKRGYIHASSVHWISHIGSKCEVSFDVHKQANHNPLDLWAEISDLKLIYCPEIDVWFEISVELEEENGVVKHVNGVSLGEAELSQVNLYGVEINTEVDIAREDYSPTVLFDELNPNSSLLNRILDKTPHYSIRHVDASIAKIQRVFSFDSQSVLDCLQEVAEEIGAIVVVHSDSTEDGVPSREISMYDLLSCCHDCGERNEYMTVCSNCGSANISNGFGEDTGIFVTEDNLADNITYQTDVGSVKNCFRLVAGDDLMTATIASCNPNGSSYLWYFSEETKQDMSAELRSALERYDSQYTYYENDYHWTPSVDLIDSYNRIVDKYSEYSDGITPIPSSCVGFASLINAYYNTVDLRLFLHDELMPPTTIHETTAQQQASLLSSSALSPVAVSDLSSCTTTIANNAVLAMAKTIVDPRYRVKVDSGTYSEQLWTGRFVVENYSDAEDVATTVTVVISINDDFVEFTRQRIEKVLSNSKHTGDSIAGIFSLSTSGFASRLQQYSLTGLVEILDACRACLDIMIEQGIANKESWLEQERNLYEEIYLPYFNKYSVIQDEIALRERELSVVTGEFDSNGNLISEGVQNLILAEVSRIQRELNFEHSIGADLWKELLSYRREDTYTNSNYISIGLTNREVIAYATEFIETAKREIVRSAIHQHTISASLKNLLAMKEFAPLVDSFKAGNWIRIMADGEVYKLRLVSFEIDFDDLNNLSVEFSDVLRFKDGFSDIESVLKQASSMATSYNAVTHQVDKTAESTDAVSNWIAEGLSLTKMKIVDSASDQNITWDEHGLLCRQYLPITKSYDDKQLKLINRGLYLTNDAWLTSAAGIGDFTYYNPETKEMEQGYGVIANTLIGNLILSEKVGIYNTDNSITLDQNGIVITTNGDNVDGDQKVFTIQKKTTDEAGVENIEQLLFADNEGNLHFKGTLDAAEGKFTGEVTATSLFIGEKTVDDYISEVAGTTVGEEFDSLKEELRDDIDGKTTTYYGATEPESPVVNDIWYDTANGRIWRYNGTGWDDITNDALKAALDAAGTAQATADGKIVTYAQDDPPVNGNGITLAIGDLWIDTNDNNTLKRWNGTAWVEYRNTYLDYLIDEVDSKTTTFYSGEAPTAMAVGDIWYDTDDGRIKRWNGSKWVDITDDALRAALEAAGTAQATADGKIVTYAQPEAPIESNGIDLCIGDLWIDTNDDNNLYRWNGTMWVSYRDGKIGELEIAYEYLIDEIDGKTTTFYSSTTPANPATGDIWYDTDDGLIKRYNGSKWVNITDDALKAALDAAANAKSVADGKIRTFAQTSAPTSMSASDLGDLWIDTDDNNMLYRWNGSSWIPYRDGKIGELEISLEYLIDAFDGQTITYYSDTVPSAVTNGDIWYNTSTGVIQYYQDGTWTDITDNVLKSALDAAENAKTVADGKIRTFAQNDAPTNLLPEDVGDLWIDTNDDNKLYRWSGTEWISYRDGMIGKLKEEYDILVDIVDGKTTTYYKNAAPTTEDEASEGDIWYDTANGKIWRYSTAKIWEDITDEALKKALDAAGTAQATADGKIVTYAQDDPPTNSGDTKLSVGDLWIDTNDENQLYRWDGSKWDTCRDGGIQGAIDKSEEALESVKEAKDFAEKIYNGEKGIFFTDSSVISCVLNSAEGLKIAGKDTYFQAKNDAMGFFKNDDTALMYCEDGNLYLTGTVCALAGYIGAVESTAWTIGDRGIYSGSASSLGAAGGTYIGSDGISIEGAFIIRADNSASAANNYLFKIAPKVVDGVTVYTMYMNNVVFEGLVLSVENGGTGGRDKESASRTMGLYRVASANDVSKITGASNGDMCILYSEGATGTSISGAYTTSTSYSPGYLSIGLYNASGHRYTDYFDITNINYWNISSLAEEDVSKSYARVGVGSTISGACGYFAPLKITVSGGTGVSSLTVSFKCVTKPTGASRDCTTVWQNGISVSLYRGGSSTRLASTIYSLPSGWRTKSTTVRSATVTFNCESSISSGEYYVVFHSNNVGSLLWIDVDSVGIEGKSVTAENGIYLKSGGGWVSVASSTGANGFVLLPATSSELGGVMVGDNITVNAAGMISLSKSNVVSALGYTPSAIAFSSNCSSGTALATLTIDGTPHTIFAPAGTTSSAVTSVNGETGDVEITLESLGAASSSHDHSDYLKGIIAYSGSSLSASAGIVTLPRATTSAYGLVKSGNTSITTTTAISSGGYVACPIVNGIPYYLPGSTTEGSTVSVTPVVTSGTKIATITVNGSGTDIFAPAITGGSTVAVSPSLTSGTKVASITVDGTLYDLFAPSAGSSISVETLQSSGTAIATITINGVLKTLYAPTGSGSGGNSNISVAPAYSDGLYIGFVDAIDFYVPYAANFGSYGVVRTTSSISTQAEITSGGYIACPIVDGIPYYRSGGSSSGSTGTGSQVSIITAFETGPCLAIIDVDDESYYIRVPNRTLIVGDEKFNLHEFQSDLTFPTASASKFGVVKSKSSIATAAAISSGGYQPCPIVDGAPYYLPGSGSSESTVSISPILKSGTQIATITIDGSPTTLYAPNPGSTVSVSRSVTSGTKIATITIDGRGTDLYAPTTDGVAGSTVSVTAATFASANKVKIATITVDGEATELYAPYLAASQMGGYNSTNGVAILNIGTTTIYAPKPESGAGVGSVSCSAVFTNTNGTKIGTITVDSTTYNLFAPAVSITRHVTSGTKIATISVGGSSTILYAPTSSATTSGSTVEVTTSGTAGKLIATITVDGDDHKIYAPVTSVNGSTGAVTITASSIDAAAEDHKHAASDITSGTLSTGRGGTGITSNPSMLVNLASTTAASVFAASPRPGVTGVLGTANGGTGYSTVDTTPTSGSKKMVTSGGVYTALSGKADSDHGHTGYAASGHTHTGYASSTHTHSGYADEDHTHTASEIGAAAASHTHSGYASSSHTHSEYSKTDHTHSGYASSTHTHTGYASSSHTHSDYADADHTHTASEIGAAAASHTHSGYASSTHTHTASEIGAAASGHSHSEYMLASNIVISSTQPSSPKTGMIWIKI